MPVLSLKSFVRHFELYDRQYSQARYRTILEKYFEHDAKASLLAELKQWNLSMDSTDFWKEQVRSKQQISPTDSSFKIETDLQEILALSDILFLAPNEHSTLKPQVFGLATLHSLCDYILSDLMETTDSTENNRLTDDEFMIITRTIYAIDAKTKSIREAKLDLLSLSARMTGNKAGVVEGIANLLTKLPRNRLLNLNKIGEVELQTTYYDALLSEIIADQDRNVALRWANKSSSEEGSDIRPDAIISTLMQHDFGYPVGFGEVKPGNSSTTKHSVCMDILRLGIASKRAIDKWHLSGCLAFMINGFYISFFVVRKQHKHLYTMTEIGAMTAASSLSELHSFASLKNLDMLSNIGHCFWNHCNATDTIPNVESTSIDDGFVIHISDFYALIDKSRNKARGMSSRY
ncbi:hypothetical protein INT48_005376 [Thamnidium elegans]|uniref:Uncharacterized protein n=1 Tax=Thamnidium elegans TaxID=101142 RepID=A0A8H7VTY4_9FUNG|nr:hypothetical protein INT48_005376 [Thamnidium elegans]